MTATEYLVGLGACLTTSTVTGEAADVDQAMDRWVNHLSIVRLHEYTVHLVGNGGSASVVAHAQNDLAKACGIRSLVYQDIPLLTAYANDNGYQRSYADILETWVDAHDVLIAVSSSGQSINILQSVIAAAKKGATVVTLSGFSPQNPLRFLGQLNFYVPSSDYGQVELTHAALLHCLTDRLATHAG